jgi:hypothetical protein
LVGDASGVAGSFVGVIGWRIVDASGSCAAWHGMAVGG